MNYDAALAYLDSHIDLERSRAVAGKVEGLRLDNVSALCHALGDPQRASPVIHLTGTNGKGSTARMVTALLVAHELSVGTFTSPHLERLNERFTRNLEPISDDELAQIVTEVADVEPLAGVDPSYFDLLAAIGFAWFASLPVDVTVLEVGLLGRHDATNVADATVAVLTNVGKDHTDAQGDWRRRIAEEKAGIVKPGSTFVCGETDPALRDVFEGAGAEALWLRDRDFECVERRLAVGGAVLAVRTPAGVLDDVYLPLHGAHQADNAVIALAAVEAFFGRALDGDVVRDAMAGVRVPCRFEVVHRQPLVVLDGAHNPDGARAAARTLAEEIDVEGRRHIVLGMLGGRDPIEMAHALELTSDDDVITTTPPSPRGIPAAELASLLRAAGMHAHAIDEVDAAVRSAVAAASEDDLVLVTGSLYVVGDARSTCRALGWL